MTLTRYDHCVPAEALHALGVSMTARADGPYVLHTDHLADKAEAVESSVCGFIGWLSADISELNSVEVPKLAESWARYKAALAEHGV